jgi:tetratricopeptide (TPR) repeat protein
VICLKCLEKNPARRYDSAVALAEDLRRFQAGEPIRARPLRAPARGWRWCRRHPRLAALTACLVLALALAGGAWAWLWHERAARAEAVARTVHAIAADLDEAARLGGEARAAGMDLLKLTEAVAAARRAQARLAEQVVDADWSLRVESQLHELERQERAAREQLRQADAERRLLQALEEFISEGTTHTDRHRFFDEKMQAFCREHGIDVDHGKPAAAAWLRQHGLRGELCIALYYWVAVRYTLHGNWQQLARLIGQVDTDPWRRRLEPALASAEGNAALERLADEAAAADLSPETAVVLTCFLQPLSAQKSLRLLQPTWQRHPGHHLLTLALAITYTLPTPPRYEEAIRYYLAALAQRPSALIYYQLGQLLERSEHPEQALGYYRQMVQLRPSEARSWRTLGLSEWQRGYLDEAVASFQEAARLAPTGKAYSELCPPLLFKRDLPAAEAVLRQALALQPDLAVAHFYLGNVLYQQGRLNEALDHYRQAHALGRALPDGTLPTGRAIANTEKLQQLEALFPAFVQGQAQALPEWRENLEQLCHCRGYGAMAARLYQSAPVAPARVSLRRFAAALGALRAGCGLGPDGAALSEPQRVLWRRQALDWLRQELAARKACWPSDSKARQEFEQQTRRWHYHLGLAPVRGEALARFSAEERRGWEELWKEVDTLLQRCCETP